MRFSAALFALGLAGLITGCEHVTLPSPPPPGASETQLARYRASVAPATTAIETRKTEYVDWVGVPVQEVTDSNEVLKLKNGVVVRDPEDLIPVVGADSACGRAARDAADARGTSGLLGGAGGVLAVSAIVLALTHPESAVGITLPVAGVVAAVGAAGSFVGMALQQPNVDSTRSAAFKCYVRSFY